MKFPDDVNDSDILPRLVPQIVHGFSFQQDSLVSNLTGLRVKKND